MLGNSRDCVFTYNIEIRNGDSYSIFDYNLKLRINPHSSVIMGDPIWLCINTKVIKGSQITSGVIVGSGSIETVCLDADTIYAGIPTKKLRIMFIGKEKDNNKKKVLVFHPALAPYRINLLYS